MRRANSACMASTGCRAQDGSELQTKLLSMSSQSSRLNTATVTLHTVLYCTILCRSVTLVCRVYMFGTVYLRALSHPLVHNSLVKTTKDSLPVADRQNLANKCDPIGARRSLSAAESRIELQALRAIRNLTICASHTVRYSFIQRL